MNATEHLRKSLLRITDPGDLDRLPYGTIIVAGIEDEPGVYTLMKIDQGVWRTVEIYGNPSTVYQIEEGDEDYTPILPALLVLCGEELPEEPEPPRNFILIKGGGDES